MRRVRILQVGDIHYPDWHPSSSNIDAKDSKFAPKITQKLRASSLRAVLTKLRRLTTSKPLDTIAFMGDFTSRGDKTFIASAFQHFTLLCRAQGRSSKALPLIFVPGNHDVNRDDARELGPTEKFSEMASLAARLGWQTVPVDQPVHFRLPTGSAGANFILVNTAIGSWELQNLPAFLRDRLEALSPSTEPVDLGSPDISGHSPATPPSDPDKEASDDEYYGQMDTPYISREMLAGLQELLQQPDMRYGIMIGHHNLLPQKTPRITPYAEMLNSGFVRTQLLQGNKPIVYLHGHIHADPVEIVNDPRFPDGKLICISAPEIQSGFNELVFFTTDQGELVGIRLIPYRTNVADGTVMEGEHCFISTMSNGKAFLNNDTFDLLRRLRDHATRRGNGLLFWDEITEIAASAELGLDLEDSLLMLQAARFIEIDGLTKANSAWRIKVRDE
ncbi:MULTISPECIES: metallophosphoesterase [unclassified Mesorhizobium]|uniref:metallophosphoesterase family protein n=1 Tax=unclassified Mesorhizobium TaxID=325217 RepID=UPI000FD499AF|nr:MULTISPECIES: metallophosphoesterase [unclassified Mesorhizobium]RUX07816.1 metallophosphoesterase [Mesorhizobium sp. M8A.F.Ca.ET.023.01.1.1]RVD57725.1 metallophosphoesterase [Mesorhizobium sp. M8A.F.Ca.ET.023.02.2.1]TGR37386.1 metallophosphoesterase [bacterium M00.F.Ca.ET.199.01.1.1]TGV82706.1 metallophosphoesterase [Mesorhizobium sp. M00.F.Ca.ET.149.01.1.1]RWC73155.1 MAG: metallophosphoesterase [Mesorhizobium sp.]